MSDLTVEILLIARAECRGSGLDPDNISDETSEMFIRRAKEKFAAAAEDQGDE